MKNTEILMERVDDLNLRLEEILVKQQALEQSVQVSGTRIYR